ncbi:hypothetical protein [Polaribacter sp. MED152]|uniref:hypothetical protein n=1 Tax=Polaribacter sp. MED152 TaxID=313598 RepID=UPI000068CC5B|nr:hypothetical protein [Polaribacter sp. MED152]EAQ41254.1 hypothetical protein MED152_01030 [Polaribacter sp. MED152]
MLSHFGELKKKEKSNEEHKFSLRKKLRIIKENYIGYGKNGEKEYEFPKLSEIELKEFREKWIKKRKRDKIKTNIIITLTIIFGIIMAFLLRFYL